MEKENNFFPAPCKEKKCAKCCNPVLIRLESNVKEGNLPKDKDGKDIWIERKNEKWIPMGTINAPELTAYDCIHLDKEGKKCRAHDKRPEICESSSCEKNGMTFEKVQEQKYLIKKYD